MVDLVKYADSIGSGASKSLTKAEQKSLGQFMTPSGIASIMASRVCAGVEGEIIRVLDPAAGGGILASAVLEVLLARDSKAEEIQITLCELDLRLIPLLKRLASRMRSLGRASGVKVKVSIVVGDFLLSALAVEGPQFDVVISNPPYFKINKSDPRALKHAYAVYGQPNIYGLFMAACARVLAPQGRWCFITPRSWTNGPYFAAVRRQILKHLRIDAMHVFESRQEHFTGDEVLQEAMITWATVKSDAIETIVVSTSKGLLDIDSAILRSLPSCAIVDSDNENLISLPTIDGINPLKGFTNTLASFGLKVSTGPIVAFRAAQYISEFKSSETVPLLWMQHINHMQVAWPINKKREHVVANASTAWMLIQNQNMVVMRRFSPKEDRRRITAAPLLSNEIPGDFIGLENHTNYIYRPGGVLSPDEVRGLSAYLNSPYVDGYLRVISGNTQINASDLRLLPLPPLSFLLRIGAMLPSRCTLTQADRIVEEILETEFKFKAA
jgi:adenine-specific DNA-methyltransferase